MKKVKRGSFVAATALIVALGMPAVGSAALGDSATDQNKVNVNFTDLDLTQDSGVSILYQRLRAAARQACGSTSVFELGSIQRVSANKQCYNSSLSKAVTLIGNDRLARIHTS